MPNRSGGLRGEQRRWLTRVRDRCTDADCLRQAYRQRASELKALNAIPLELANAPFEPLFERTIAHIDDTWVVRGVRLRASTPRCLQFELHVDPTTTWPGFCPAPGCNCPAGTRMRTRATPAGSSTGSRPMAWRLWPCGASEDRGSS